MSDDNKSTLPPTEPSRPLSTIGKSYQPTGEVVTGISRSNDTLPPVEPSKPNGMVKLGEMLHRPIKTDV